MRRTVLMLVIMGITTVPADSQDSSAGALMFVADLRGEHVAPGPVDTLAVGKATAVLIGNRLTVHGSFSGLSSALRDMAKTPDDPGVHLHRGAAGETSRYFHGLQVTLDDDERSGIFFGVVVLTDEQRLALLAEETYVDIHTVKHQPGEVRDQWRPFDPVAAARALASVENRPPMLASATFDGSRCH